MNVPEQQELLSPQEIPLKPSWGIWKRWLQISLWVLVLCAGGGFGGGLKLKSFLLLLVCWLLGTSLFLLLQAVKIWKQRGRLLVFTSEIEVHQWGTISRWDFSAIHEFSIHHTTLDRGGYPDRYHVHLLAHMFTPERQQEQLLSLHYEYPCGETDPGLSLQERWKNVIRQRTEAAIQQSRGINYGTWIWQNGRLMRSSHSPETSRLLLPPTAFGNFGGKFSVWTGPAIAPYLQFSVTEPNLWLLEELMESTPAAERISLKQEPSFPPRRLFERRHSPLRMALFFLATAFTALSALGLFVLALERGRPRVLILAGFYSMTAFFLGRHYYYLIKYRWLCRQDGIHSLNRKRKLVGYPWAEIAGFRYDNRPIKQGGFYLGKNRLLFVCYHNSGANVDQLSSHRKLRGTDADLEWLRDQLAEMIGREMLSQTLVGEMIDWTVQLRLEPHGISWRVRTEEPWQRIEFADITWFEIQRSRFYVWANYQERAVIAASTAEANFYPGLYAFERMFALFTNGHLDPKEPAHAVREESRPAFL